MVQSIELYELYQCIKDGNHSTNYHVFVWIIYLAAFYIFMAIASTGFVEFYSMPMFCYMMLFLAVIGIWIFLDIQAEAWDVETEQHRAELEEQDKKMLQMKVKAMEEQYREMLKSRKIVHDMKNHLLALKKYTQEQDWKGLEEYLNELSRDILDYNYQIWTGNHMLDMILNQKEKEAEKQKTQMQISTEVFTTLPFSDREIISLFGNLLDNALEACEQIKEGERWIHIKMKKKNQLLYIEIVNAAKNTGIQIDENFVSTKKDGVLHGYGMKNIRDIVEQYNGMFQCKSQEDRFEVVITIYGYEAGEYERNKEKKIYCIDNYVRYDFDFCSASVGGFEREKLQYICSIFPNQSKRNQSTFGDGSVCLGWEYYDNPDTVNTAYCISDRDCITCSDAVAA